MTITVPEWQFSLSLKALGFVTELCMTIVQALRSWWNAGSITNPFAGGRKRINLPAIKKVKIDMEHIRERHMLGGGNVFDRDVFPDTWTVKDVESAITQAYGSARRIAQQAGSDFGGDKRSLLSGKGNGISIEMWLNESTKVIETAYPQYA